jgi:tRNA dimethylallyltransferase
MNFDDTQTAHEWIKPPLLDCFYLTGPTSSGKTPLAIEVAKRLNAEILSLDSMAVYRGMDIGTAKPSPAEQAETRHHLIDIAEPTESFSVSCYVQAAHAAAADVRSRGKRVLVVGGTPLYLKCLLRGLFVGPPADWDFRQSVESDLKVHGPEALKARLAQVDPLLAFRLHLHDTRRIIRGLEVARLTGRPLSHWQEQFDNPAPRNRAPVGVLKLDRAWLHERINLRVDKMLAAGLQAEVEQLLRRYSKLGHTAAQAVGYREMLQQIQGELPENETVDKIKAHTRQFARRQEIWFRGLEELQPFNLTPETELAPLAEALASWFVQQSDAAVN